jgi:hypothetical protein
MCRHNYVPDHECLLGIGGVGPHNFSLKITWNTKFSFMSHPLYPRRKRWVCRIVPPDATQWRKFFSGSHSRCTAYNHKDRYINKTQLVNILLLRCFIHIAYLRSNYMFRPFFLGHHQVDHLSNSRQPYNFQYQVLLCNEISFSSIKFLVHLNIKFCEF